MSEFQNSYPFESLHCVLSFLSKSRHAQATKGLATNQQCATFRDRGEDAMTFQEMLKERLSPTDWQRLQAFTASMEPERRVAMMQFIAQCETHAPAVGDEAPDFELPRLNSAERVW